MSGPSASWRPRGSGWAPSWGVESLSSGGWRWPKPGPGPWWPSSSTEGSHSHRSDLRRTGYILPPQRWAVRLCAPSLLGACRLRGGVGDDLRPRGGRRPLRPGVRGLCHVCPGDLRDEARGAGEVAVCRAKDPISEIVKWASGFDPLILGITRPRGGRSRMGSCWPAWCGKPRARFSSSPIHHQGVGGEGRDPSDRGRTDPARARPDPFPPCAPVIHRTFVLQSGMDTTIRNLDERAYRALKARAALTGRTIGETVNEAIETYLARPASLLREGTLADLRPQRFPPGNERLSEEVDPVVYGGG